LFLILSSDFATAAVSAVVVVRGGGAGGDAVEDDNIFSFSFSSSSCFPSSGEELSGRECDEGFELQLLMLWSSFQERQQRIMGYSAAKSWRNNKQQGIYTSSGM
jgi:hypothetical protein